MWSHKTYTDEYSVHNNDESTLFHTYICVLNTYLRQSAVWGLNENYRQHAALSKTSYAEHVPSLYKARRCAVTESSLSSLIQLKCTCVFSSMYILACQCNRRGKFVKGLTNNRI